MAEFLSEHWLLIAIYCGIMIWNITGLMAYPDKWRRKDAPRLASFAEVDEEDKAHKK
jgi:hypothetical protein